MENINNIFTHEDTKALYRKEKIKYFKLFKFVMIFVGLIGIIYIVLAGYYLNDWNTKQLATGLQAPETETAKINGKDAVIYTHSDGTKSARVQIEKCSDVAVVSGIVKHYDREVIFVQW